MFATVICLVFPMCILTSCSSVSCVLMALGMFVKVMSSLMIVMSHLLVCVHCLCVWWCISFLCELYFLYEFLVPLFCF